MPGTRRDGIKETKRDKFVRLAEARTNKILNMLELLGNFSNSNIYEYTHADINQIFSANESQVKETRRRFQTTSEKKSAKFVLKDR